MAEIDSLLQPAGDRDAPVIGEARDAIRNAASGNLPPERIDGFRRGLETVLELSPRPEHTATEIIARLQDDAGLASVWGFFHRAAMFIEGGGGGRARPEGSENSPASGAETGEGSSTTSPAGKTIPRPSTNHIHLRDPHCRVTGAPSAHPDVAHIMPFALQNNASGAGTFVALLGMFLGKEGLDTLVRFLQAPSKHEGGRKRANLKGWRNLVLIHVEAHRYFDHFELCLEIDWDTYDRETGQFDATFRWTVERHDSLTNYWVAPMQSEGDNFRRAMKSGDLVQFRHIGAKEYPLPSPTLFALHRLVSEVALISGAAGLPDDWPYDSDEFDRAGDDPLEHRQSRDETNCAVREWLTHVQADPESSPGLGKEKAKRSVLQTKAGNTLIRPQRRAENT